MSQPQKDPSLKWKIICAALAALLVVAIVSIAINVPVTCAPQKPAATVQAVEQTAMQTVEPVAEAADDPLSLWTEDAKLKKQLTAYIAAVTDENSADYIPLDHRIAVFDFDGTLFCETDPCYFDYRLLMHRVLEDSDYIDKASEFEKETAAKCVRYGQGESIEGLETDHGKAIASSFKGFTVDEFYAYVKAFRDQAAPSYNGMTNGEGFYRPMLQVIRYLEDNGFTVYVISGTDRLIVRGAIRDSMLDLPMAQVIGSDETLVATHQDGMDGLKYQYTQEDELVTGGEFIIKNLKMNKVTVIQKEIGVQPVLSFGNSSGDTSMANYTITNNPFRSAAYMLCCDDLERENGNLEKAQKMLDSCEANGWTAISMKNDWTTIYGEGVTKK